jgi:monothiol glutaredoxin
LNSFGFAASSSSSSSSTRSYSDDSHSDFQTQYKPQSKIQDVAKVIESDVKSHKVFVYMKGIPEAPQCGFSNMVCRILEAYDVEFGSRNVLEDMEVRQGIKDFTSWPTIPQVFVDGEFMGGCDILMEMHKSGELEDAIKGTGDKK